MRANRFFLCLIFLAIGQVFAGQMPVDAEPKVGQSPIERCSQDVLKMIIQALCDEDVASLSAASRTEYSYLTEAWNERPTLYWRSGQIQSHELANNALSACFSHDGNRVVARLADGTIRTWDVTTGQTAVIGPKIPWFARLSPDCKRVASWSQTAIKVWDVASAELIKVLKVGLQGVSVVEFSADGHQLAVGSLSGSITMWDLETGRRENSLGHFGPIISLSFSPDGVWLASGSTLGPIMLTNLKNGRSKHALTPSCFTDYHLQFLPDGILAFFGPIPIKLWDKKFREVKELKDHYYKAHSIACSPDRKILAAGFGLESIGLWNLETGEKINILERKGCHETIVELAFSPDGKKLVSRSSDHRLRLWSMKRFEYQESIC